MADPTSNPAHKWLFPLVIALLAVLLLVWFLDPSGDEDTGQVEDPIVTGDMSEPALADPQPLDAADPGDATDAPATQPDAAPALEPAGTPTQ